MHDTTSTTRDARQAVYMAAHEHANTVAREIALCVRHGAVVTDDMRARYISAEDSETVAWRDFMGRGVTPPPSDLDRFECVCGVTFVCPEDPTLGERGEFDSKVAQHRALPHHQGLQRIGLAPADGELPGITPATDQAVSA